MQPKWNGSAPGAVCRVEAAEGESQLEDEALIALAQKGDVDAFEHLVQRYQDIALRAAYILAGDAGEAEDIVQESFVKAYNGLRRFRRGSPFRPWLLAIVTNEAKNRRASSHRRTIRETLWSRSQDGGRSLSPEQYVLASERRRYLLAALNTLSEQDRTIIVCRYLLELSEAEIATIIGRPPGTVKSRLSRALRRLRERVTDRQSELLTLEAVE